MNPGRILALFLSGPLSGLLSGLMFVAPVPIAGAQTATTPDGVVETVTAIIEIPSGGTVKYERDAEGYIFVDRFLAMPVAYPANYGSIDGTLAGDGDPLDILVYSREPIIPGARIKVRPIGILRMVDGGEDDQKIIAVPVSKVDPDYEKIKSVADLPAGASERLAAFFRVYKQDANGDSPVILSGYGDAKEALAVLREAFTRAAAKAD